MTDDEMKKTLQDYKEKANILKQIHSNKKESYECKANWLDGATLIVSVILTVAGFINRDTIYELFMGVYNKEYALKRLDFYFNIIVLSVLIVTILNMIFRFRDKAFESNRAIILFSNLTREINEFRISSASFTVDERKQKISQISYRYSSIIDFIPSNSDDDYKTGKEDYLKKKAESKAIDEKYKNSN